MRSLPCSLRERLSFLEAKLALGAHSGSKVKTALILEVGGGYGKVLVTSFPFEAPWEHLSVRAELPAE